MSNGKKQFKRLSYFQISRRFDIKIKHSMTSHLIQHVLKKWNVDVQASLTLSIKVQVNFDLRFFGNSFYACAAITHGFLPANWP